MSQTDTPDGLAGHRGDPSGGGRRRPRATALVAGGVVCVLALVFLAGGGWALWKDRVDRDDAGFVSFGSNHLRTEQYAIVGDLRGDGPGWLYGSTLLGDTRIRATSQTDQPLFVGIARKDDVLAYLQGAGYATVEGFEVTADTTHDGHALPGRPSRESIWAASTEGTGRRTLRWTPRAGDWSVVLVNLDGRAGVDVRGDASAELPVLPWLAGGLLLVGGAAGAAGAWILLRAMRRAAAVPSQGSRPSPDGEGGERTMDSHRSLLERYVELYNAGDVDGIMELYADDAVQLMPDGIYRGRDAIHERLRRELPAFPDVHWDVVSFVENGDSFADEWTFAGTHTGPFPLPDGTELPPTGKRVEVRGMEYVQMRDGKIVVDNLYYDNLAIATQLGLLPQAATA